uniref:E3 ubiquitin-protein ligase CHIP n=2 Tax=Hemiselmis andersenii TaxID=464988 RepID=A0A6U4NET5_HEMAN|mmetsp:Transcript_5703/g.13178  ORF Transcript_5703/g.13178 Transcript_5703/m.13178 type:complete len:266 (+) Transcript_5703:39-836(+)
MSALPAREQGKLFFQKGKYAASAEAYTEAITNDRDNAGLYQNRALCYQKLCRWEDASSDALRAIELSPESVKALYIGATAHHHLNKLDIAEEMFRKALTLAGGESQAYRDSVETGLYSVLEAKQKERRSMEEKEEEDAVSLVEELLQEGEQVEAETLGEGVASERRSERRAMVEGLRERFTRLRVKPSVPEALCCQITFELMKDPVMTPGGQTYERSAIEWHVRQNGSWDPVTRQPFDRHQLRPNLALKEVIGDFLSRNPWAYEA